MRIPAIELLRLITRISRCPQCGARRTVPVIYGLPGPPAIEAAERGDVELGGCVIGPSMPNRACRACGHRWRSGPI